MNPEREKLLVTYLEAAELLSCSTAKIRRLVASGIIPTINLNSGLTRHDGQPLRAAPRIDRARLMSFLRRPND